MTDREIREWFHDLARTPGGRIEVIQELLCHAGEDHMSMKDRSACGRALQLCHLDHLLMRVARTGGTPKSSLTNAKSDGTLPVGSLST